MKKILAVCCLVAMVGCTKEPVQAPSTASSPEAKNCVELGGELTRGPRLAPGAEVYVANCCANLLPVIDPKDEAAGVAPGRMLCAACGDGVCDNLKFESKTNCPKDCK